MQSFYGHGVEHAWGCIVWTVRGELDWFAFAGRSIGQQAVLILAVS